MAGNYPSRSIRYRNYLTNRDTVTANDEARTYMINSRKHEADEVKPWLRNIQNRGTLNLRKGRVLREFSIPENYKGLCSVRFSPNGKNIAMSYGSGAITFNNACTGELISTIKGSEVSNTVLVPILCVRFSSDREDRFFASGACGNIYVCLTKIGKYEKFVTEPENEINSFDINCKNTNMASGGKDAIVRIYDLILGKLLNKFGDSTNSHVLRIFACKYHPLQKDVLVTGGWDDIVKVWDCRVKDGFVRNIVGPHICGEGIDLRDKEVLTGSWVSSNSIQLWDFGSGKLIDCITPHNRSQPINGEFLYCIKYLPGDSTGDCIVCGGSGTDMAEVISLSAGKVLACFKVNKPVLTLDTHHNSLVFGGMDKTVKITEYIGTRLHPCAMHQSRTSTSALTFCKFPFRAIRSVSVTN